MGMQARLLSWYKQNGRDLPWRQTKDPYKILISEIMLQQTQVDRVISKYVTWLRELPDFASLAKAPRRAVLRAWSGLGYNNRAVRLHTLAKLLVEQHDAQLPDEEQELRKLPGIGPYTAGAIMVFAHNKPGTCVDVNIDRIIKRIYFFKTQTKITKNDVEEKFLHSFPAGHARDWGNCLMDFGSRICTPTKPRCNECPIFTSCKSKGERPDEQSLRKKKRQAPFLHSNRWWRGQILKALLQNESLSHKALRQKVIPDKENGTRWRGEKFHNALKQLKQDGLIAGKKRLKIKG